MKTHQSPKRIEPIINKYYTTYVKILTIIKCIHPILLDLLTGKGCYKILFKCNTHSWVKSINSPRYFPINLYKTTYFQNIQSHSLSNFLEIFTFKSILN